MKSPNCTGWCDQNGAVECGLTVCPHPTYVAPAETALRDVLNRNELALLRGLIREVARCETHAWKISLNPNGIYVDVPSDLWNRLRAYLPQ